MSTPAQVAASRANSQKSTGPKTAEGKQRSCRNAHKHGLYSREIVQDHEDEAEYNRFRAALMAEHQPVNTTETFLVDELAQNGWKIRRLRKLEAWTIQRDAVEVHIESGFLAALTRCLAGAERMFHRALTALAKMQKERGFVPQNLLESAEIPAETLEFDSVDAFKPNPCKQPRSSASGQPAAVGFVSQNATQSQPAPAPTRSTSSNRMPHPA